MIFGNSEKCFLLSMIPDKISLVILQMIRNSGLMRLIADDTADTKICVSFILNLDIVRNCIVSISIPLKEIFNTIFSPFQCKIIDMKHILGIVYNLVN